MELSLKMILILKKLTINITALDDGIRGKDSIDINKSTLVLNVEDDALKSDNSEEGERGVITIEEGIIEISAGG